MTNKIPDNELGIAAWDSDMRPLYGQFFRRVPEDGELWIHDTAIPNLKGKIPILRELIDKNITIRVTIIHPFSYCCYARSLEMIGFVNSEEILENEIELHFTFSDFQNLIYENLVAYKSLYDYSSERKKGKLEVFFYDTLPGMPMYISLNKDGLGEIYYSHFLSSATDFAYYILLKHSPEKENYIWNNMVNWLRHKFTISSKIDLESLIISRSKEESPMARQDVLNYIGKTYPINEGGKYLSSIKEAEVNAEVELSDAQVTVLKWIQDYPKKSVSKIARIKSKSPKTLYGHLRAARFKLGITKKGRVSPKLILEEAQKKGLID